MYFLILLSLVAHVATVAHVAAKGHDSVPFLMEAPGFMNDELSDEKAVNHFSELNVTAFGEKRELWLKSDQTENTRYISS